MDYDLYQYDITKIKPLVERIVELEKSKGLDGREVQLAKRVFPEGAPAEQLSSWAIMWRLVARPGETQEDWIPLIFLSELKGGAGFCWQVLQHFRNITA